MTKKLTDKVAIVTGGARGIGGQIAMAFAAEGADVVIADVLSEAAAERVIASIAESGRRSRFVHTNVADEKQVRAMVDIAVAEFGRVDILVNNAGTFSEHGCEDLSIEEFDRVVGVNLRGSFMCSRFVIPGMLERKSGVIINVASQLGQIGGLDMVHYCASKAGIIGMTKAMAREVATRGVRVNAIAPGPIVTDMMAEESEEWAARKLSELPMARFGEVDEVAPTAVFLASEDSSYYVGQTLCPNGGDVML
ncbi:SDR family NAD(P)-dependent oxidoreductase [Mycobacterium sp. AZCC_0083]|uniref:SDR family NAD(P)-dependent oxidoreductase n=1 Tax=Mycobacterium sp. AZCC_0083 TaxID=2735882 RepID=UPI00161349E3|nr:3-oxoacyl-ACP reductase family protein [Mycobacterium sp. AZCC_0083]MBB5166821.1 3-oxoacyl-[acyl-carrier protein] reductase [Mycobacterium sp. AZCC_0083]